MKRIIELTPEQKQVYEQMRKEALATLNGKTVTTMIALTQLMRLQQITCGHFVADDGTTQEIKSNRLNELMDVLEEVEGKAIIWAHWQADIKRIIELTPEQKQVYEQMRKEALATLNGKTVTTMIALTQLMRLHQITCGHFAADDGTIQTIKNNRLNELMDVLEEIEGKAIIWAHYQYDVKTIIKEITKVHGPGSVVDYYGLTPQGQRDTNREQFQENDKCRFLVGTPHTGGYGITLTAANTVIYYSNGYDLEKRLQSEDRAHRIGQKKSVTYVDILAEETVDEKIVKSLRKKINIASEVLGEELRSWI